MVVGPVTVVLPVASFALLAAAGLRRELGVFVLVAPFVAIVVHQPHSAGPLYLEACEVGPRRRHCVLVL